MKAQYIHLSLASILVSGIVFAMSPAWAQTDASSDQRTPAAEDAPPARDGKGEKIKTLNFEDELVEGDTQKPELFYLFQKKNFNYKRLIKLRENFLPEMRKTSEEVQRVRSQD